MWDLYEGRTVHGANMNVGLCIGPSWRWDLLLGLYDGWDHPQHLYGCRTVHGTYMEV